MSTESLPPVRFSALKSMSRSPAHFRHAVDVGTEETLAMRLGSGAHAILFEQPWIVFPGKVRNGKVWDAFEAEHADKVILNAREHEQSASIAAAVRSHPEARKLIFAKGAIVEKRVEWTMLGRARSGTPDVRTDRYIVELKSSRCTEPDKFKRDATWRYYHAQLADYLDGVVASRLGTPSEAYIVAVESSPPHPVTVLRLTDKAMDQGRRLCRIWMERLLGCERDNRWPGYVESIVDFDIDEPFELDGGENDDEPIEESELGRALLASVRS